MTRLRPALRPLVVAGLLLQAAVVGTAAVEVLCGGGAAAETLVCTCAHLGDHGECPMHHHGSDPAREATRCKMRGTHDNGGAALMSLLASLAMPTASVTAIAPPASADAVSVDPSRPADFLFPLDSPPPRS